ncbi:MAG: SWIM zinc finger family protein [Thermomicrobiales bacterium]
MEATPQLSEQEIRARFDAQSWQRGRQYARDGAIINARRQGKTLRASCIGSLPEPYRVELIFDPHRITSADCSCPVGDGGYCKHVVALAVTWLEHPERFVAHEDVDAALERRDKAELIDLIRRMLQRHPDLDMLLALPESAVRQPPVDPAIYRRQIATMLAREPYQWGDDIGIGWNLREMVANGDAFLRQGNYEAATGLYASVAAEIMEQYETFEDEEGALLRVVGMCVAGLGECLKGEREHTDLREEIIEAIFGVFIFAMEWGDLDLDESIPDLLVRRTTDDEKRLLTEWVYEHLPSRTGMSTDYRRREYGALLLELHGPSLDDAAFLRICRETGRTPELVDRLLALGRMDEAIAEAEATSDHDILPLADLFVRHGAPEVAERLIRERVARTENLPMLRWLRAQAETREDTDEALDLAERVLRRQPSLAAYQDVRQLARGLGRWEQMRPELVALLKQPKYRSVLIQVALDEGDIDQAITLAHDATTALSFGAGTTIYSHGYDMTLTVAKAAEATRPRGALSLYQQQAEKLIAGRHRESYRQACGYLVTVRELYDRLDEYEGWERYLAGLREKYRTLRALKEEMAAAGLLD